MGDLLAVFDMSHDNAHIRALQPRVCTFFQRAYTTQHLSQSYLFIGADGTGIDEVVCGVAQMLMCPHGACTSCDACTRVARGVHPDVHILQPESASGYVIAQIEDLIEQAWRGPICAQNKLFVIHKAQLLRDNAANALLKILEEPPSHTHFILIAHDASLVLSTIVSRCQCIPFVMPARARTEELVENAAHVKPDAEKAALYAAQNPKRAIAMLTCPASQTVRAQIIALMERMHIADSWDIIEAADAIGETMQLPVDTEAQSLASELEHTKDFLSSAAKKQLELKQKRQVTALHKAQLFDSLDMVRALLRDALCIATGMDVHEAAAFAGAPDASGSPDSESVLVCADAHDVCVLLSQTSTPTALIAALSFIDTVHEYITRNVTPQSCLEALFVGIKEKLYASSTTR